MKNRVNIKNIKLLLILLLLLVPFSISDYTDDISPEKITSDLAFYEINTCSISLVEFLLHNPNVIYQDHYKIRANNYSAIKCYGTITGIDQIGYTFYISIGTNSIINLFLQTIFWLLLISFIKKDQITKLSPKEILALIFTAIMICFGIYSQKRYYSKTLFFLDLEILNTYKYIFSYSFFVAFFSYYTLKTRAKSIFRYIPFSLLFIGVFTGFNIYFLSIFLLTHGILKTFTNERILKLIQIYNIFVFFWSYSAIGNNFYLKPDKMRGLSNIEYNFISVSYWSYSIFFILVGLFYYINESTESLSIERLKNSFVITSSTVLFLGYLGSSFPFINFMNYIYFGQTKYGTDNQNLFDVNYWGEKVAWRGFFPSAETVGEIFAITLLFIFINAFNKSVFVDKWLIFLPLLLIGFYASNNKASLFALFFCFSLKLNHHFNLNQKMKLLIAASIVLLLAYLIRFENLLYSISDSSSALLNFSSFYSLENSVSSSVEFLSELNDNSINSILFGVFSLFAFFVNRSELWGLFFAKFNPTFQEFLLGTGPFTMVDHYSDIVTKSIRMNTGTPLGFLLPHSSVLLILLFTGIIGLLFLTLLTVKRLILLRKTNYDLYLIGIFILLNILKSDSILYFPSLIFYVSILFFINPKKIIV